MVVIQVWNVPRVRSKAARFPYPFRKTSWVRSSASVEDPVKRKHNPYTRLWCVLTSSVHANESPFRHRSTRTCHSASKGFSPTRSALLFPARSPGRTFGCQRSDGLASRPPGVRNCPSGAGCGDRTDVRPAGNPMLPRFHVMVPARLMGNNTHTAPQWFPDIDLRGHASIRGEIGWGGGIFAES